MSQTEIKIAGMTCDGCARPLEAALKQAGAAKAEVDWRGGTARVSGTVDEAVLDEVLADTRYRVTDIRQAKLRRPGREGNSPTRDYDLIVLGSGGGAFAGAIRARDLGKRVLMVEHGTTGGTCVNIGCIPSKTLLVSADAARHPDGPTLAEAVARKTALVERLRQSKYVDLLAEYEIEFRHGHGRLTDPHTVEVDGEPATAEAVLVATGARPAIPPIQGLEEAGYLTSTTALDLSTAPPRLAVLGANAVGLELGQMLAGFGSTVTLIARRDVAPNGEPEIAAELREVLEAEGHTVLAPADTTEVTVEDGEKVLRGTAGGKAFELPVDEILVATGRQPNTEDLGLEDVGVKTDEHGTIVVDEEQRTSVASIYASGDVTSQPRYVYVAARGGATAVENALGGGGERLDFAALPQ